MRAPPTTTLDGDGEDGPQIDQDLAPKLVHIHSIFQAGFVDAEVTEESTEVDLSPGGPMSPPQMERSATTTPSRTRPHGHGQDRVAKATQRTATPQADVPTRSLGRSQTMDVTSTRSEILRRSQAVDVTSFRELKNVPTALATRGTEVGGESDEF